MATAITAEIRAEWRKSNMSFEVQYLPVPKSKKVELEEGEWKVISRQANDGRPFQMVEHVSDGETFTFFIHRNKKLNASAIVKIEKYAAKQDFTASNGTFVKKGTVKWYATQS